MNRLCVYPPPQNPIPPSPAPAWLGRCEGSDFTACQLRPKNTQNSEMLGQREERAGTRDGVVGGAMVTWAEKPSRHHSPARERWAEPLSPGPPSGSKSGNAKGSWHL